VRTSLAAVRTQLRVALRPRMMSGLLLVILVLMPLVVWRNVSYASESLTANLAYLRSEIPRLNADLDVADADESAEIAETLDRLRDQLASDEFDVYRSGVPGSAEVGLGLAAGAGGPLIGVLLAASVAGVDLRRGTLFWWLTRGAPRVETYVAKLVALPVLGMAVTTAMAVVGVVVAIGFNAWYRSQPLFAPGGRGWGHLLVAWLVATGVVTLWASAAAGLTFALRSGWAAAMTLGTFLAADVFLTTKVAGIAPWLLTMRIAQTGQPLWPPPSRFTVDTAGYLWWIGADAASRFPETIWAGYLAFGGVVAILCVLGWKRLASLDFLPTPDQ
jgi:hypothetical protein